MRKIVPLLALVAAACQPDVPTTNEVAPSPSTATPPATGAATSPVAADPSVPPPVHLDPDAKPLPGEHTPAGAARTVQAYCDALATRRYDDAFAMWADGGKASGMSASQFAAYYKEWTVTDCVIGTPGEMQGAAGTVYIEIPNIFRVQRADGKKAEVEGPVILKRVNDVDGSSEEQRRWHIARAEFPLPMFTGR